MNRRIVYTSVVCLAASSFALQAYGDPPSREVTVTSTSPAAVEAFKAGRDLADNLRVAEAQVEFRRAVSLQPDFALATAYLGAATPGTEGDTLLARAATLSAKLPEAERLLIEAMVAARRGDENQARSLRHRLTEIAPGDWRMQFAWGQQLTTSRKWDEAAVAYKRAVSLNPKAGMAYNSLGYAQLAQGRPEEAIAAFKKYAETNPTEPNPQDSLGEALIRAGRFDEAEAAFGHALKISPGFWGAWEGTAKARAMKGDWVGNYKALASAREAATRPIDKIGTGFDRAWSLFAEGKKDEALKACDEAEREAKAQKVDVLHAFIALDRAAMLAQSGQPEDGLKQIAVALARGDKANLAGGPMNALRRAALYGRIDIESRLGLAAEAKKTLALIETEAGNFSANAQLQSTLHFARGAAALGAGDTKGAAEHFARCNDDDTYCGWRLLQAQEKAGDTAGAAATKQRLRTANRRDAGYLFVRSQVK